jgi:hypothetical protein
LCVVISARLAVLDKFARIHAMGNFMSLTSLLLLVAIFFLILYLIWLLPAPWRVRQIIQIVAVILGLVYLFQHQSLLHF